MQQTPPSTVSCSQWWLAVWQLSVAAVLVEFEGHGGNTESHPSETRSNNCPPGL